MSSNTSNSKIHDKYFWLEKELSEIIISFKDLLKHIQSRDVYTGEEKIPFSKKEAEYRKLLISEFLT
jgi:hypothetical protein